MLHKLENGKVKNTILARQDSFLKGETSLDMWNLFPFKSAGV